MKLNVHCVLGDLIWLSLSFSTLSASGPVLALTRWGAKGGHNSSWRGHNILVYFAAELRILLVYLSESLGRLGQNGGRAVGGGTFFIGGGSPGPSAEPPLVGLFQPAGRHSCMHLTAHCASSWVRPLSSSILLQQQQQTATHIAYPPHRQA